jgi:nitrile hydratase
MMDGVHDLGGRQGFGPVPDKHDDRPFRAHWEERAFGTAQSAGGDSDWSIDWFRHCRELIVPTDYMSRPYFDQWMTLVAAQMIDAGYVTLGEIRSGKSVFTPQPGIPPATADDARAYVKDPRSYAMDAAAAPSFVHGDVVRCKRSGHSGHTRLPGYVRGRTGTVFAHRGAHALPDASARGEHKAEHLYTVTFAASELWPEASGRDLVFVDLWESYLDHT